MLKIKVTIRLIYVYQSLVRKVVLRESMETWEVFKTCNLFTVDTNILINMLNYVINVSNKLMKNPKHMKRNGII